MCAYLHLIDCYILFLVLLYAYDVVSALSKKLLPLCSMFGVVTLSLSTLKGYVSGNLRIRPYFTRG